MMMEKTQPLICCVDDEEVNLKIIASLLTKRGYRVETARNGLEALEVIAATKPALILLDVMMPELDGYEVCARLQKNPDLSYIPVIFATERTHELRIGGSHVTGPELLVPNGKVSVNPAPNAPGNRYITGTKVTLTASPLDGFSFSEWSGDCSGTDNCILVMSNDRLVNNSFTAGCPPPADTTCSSIL